MCRYLGHMPASKAVPSGHGSACRQRRLNSVMCKNECLAYDQGCHRTATLATQRKQAPDSHMAIAF